LDLNTLYGIIPPTVTPFDQNEELDEACLRREIKYLFNAGVHGVSFGGSTGEGALLTNEELTRGIRIVQEENKQNLPVLCGIIRNSTRDAIKTGLAAKEAGADVLMVTPTFYHGTSDEGNYRFFSDLSEQVGLPIIIYNVIKNNPILPKMMERLAQIENVVGIKQSVGGIHSLTDMIGTCGEKTLVFGAQDDLMYISYELGAVGAISAILTLFPEMCVKQWHAVQKKDYAMAMDIHYRMLPVWRTIEGGAFPGKIKAALKLIGRDVGVARQPIQPPTENEWNELSHALKTGHFLG
jgi:dihydrodipicolinate synthase/N-acetylneuraminate lyase